ncbi:MAG: hypothetical protein WKF36_04815 [Candidatus Nitrosocosmicus sp.]
MAIDFLCISVKIKSITTDNTKTVFMRKDTTLMPYCSINNTDEVSYRYCDDAGTVSLNYGDWLYQIYRPIKKTKNTMY